MPKVSALTELTSPTTDDTLYVIDSPDSKRITFANARLRTITAISSTTTLSSSHDYVVLDASGGSFTINLPAAASHTGRIYNLFAKDVSGNTITIDGNGSETINGATTQTMTTQYECLTLFSDGTEWWVH